MLIKDIKDRLCGQAYKKIKRRIDNFEASKAIVRELKASSNIKKDSETGFWINWYADFIESLPGEYFEALKLQRYIPKQFLPEKHKKALRDFFIVPINEALQKITKDNRLILDEVVLPSLNSKSEAEIYFPCLIDSLIAYLMRDLDKNSLINLIDHVPFNTEGIYEYKNVILESGDIVIDAGACMGEFFALAGIKGCRAYAFEPIPQIVDLYLQKTAEWNPNITICKYALADKQGEFELDYTPVALVGSSSLAEGYGDTIKVRCKQIDLDTFVNENNLPRVDFIKADIEGAERLLLTGARNVLKEFAPKISICTYHLPDDPLVLKSLILDANPNYIIEEKWMKMYAHVPK